jgi:thiol-disulfide isomerase/thioredoxin/outer membrane lipoprotein-sorting protein
MEKKRMTPANLLVLLVLSTCLYSQQSQDAMQLLKRVAQTYRSLGSYEIRAMKIEDQQLDEARDLSEIPLMMAEDKPGKFRIESKHPFMGGAEVSDGKTAWEYIAMGHQYTKKPATPDADVPSEGAFLPTNYVDHYRHLPEKATEARLLREETLPFEGKDVRCEVVEVHFAPGPEAKPALGVPHTLWIAKESALVLQEMWESKGDMMGVSSKTRTTLVYKTIRINQPVPDALFTFTPPATAKEVDALSLPGGSSRRAKTNQPSHEFSLSTLEGKKTSLSDFKGKTVLLDFWATWCVPCRESTPIIEKLHAAFGEKGLVTLAVDFGEEPDVVKGYLVHNPSALPNLVDPEKTVADLYNVSSIPTFILISKEGKVTYSSSGFGDDTEAKLRTALKQEGLE